MITNNEQLLAFQQINEAFAKKEAELYATIEQLHQNENQLSTDVVALKEELESNHSDDVIKSEQLFSINLSLKQKSAEIVQLQSALDQLKQKKVLLQKKYEEEANTFSKKMYERELEFVAKENVLNSQIFETQNTQRTQAQKNLETLIQREHEFHEQIEQLRTQMQSESQRIKDEDQEEKRALSHSFEIKERELLSQIESIRQELKKQDDLSTEHLSTLAMREKEFASELKQVVTEKYTVELKNSDLFHLLTVAQLLESQLHSELAMRQQILSDLSIELKKLQGSFTWRITAPLRAIAKLFISSHADSEEVSVTVKILEGAPSEMEESIVSSEPSNLETNLVVLDSSVNSIIEESQIPKGEEPINHIKETFMSSSPIVAATSLDELLAYHDADFIHCAYITLLGRVPDPEGIRYYLGRIRAGRAKIAVIDQLVSSAEGKRYSVQMTGLEQALTRYRWGKMPIIGVLFQKDTIVQEIRQIESSMYRLNQDMNRRFDAVEQQIKQISYSVVSSPDAQILGPDIYTTENSPDLSHISPSARKIYTMLKNAQRGK